MLLVRASTLNVATQIMSDFLKLEQNSFRILNACVLKQIDPSKSTILVEFADEFMVQNVFKNIKNFKGSRIAVERDLTEKERSVERKLVDLKKSLEINKSFKVFVTDVQIKIDGEFFKW